MTLDAHATLVIAGFSDIFIIESGRERGREKRERERGEGGDGGGERECDIRRCIHSPIFYYYSVTLQPRPSIINNEYGPV